MPYLFRVLDMKLTEDIVKEEKTAVFLVRAIG